MRNTLMRQQKSESMKIFDCLQRRGHEQVSFFNDEDTGLRGIIAIHDTTLGPALGGCRMWNYGSEEEALMDVLRLSRAMTYKAAVAGLNLGGGKAVILGNSKTDKTEMLFRAFGRFIEGLGGRYITAEDVGTTIEDMEMVRMETSFVTGFSRTLGGGGDPSPVTAKGVFYGIQACAKHRFDKDSINGMSVAIQGLGHVGMELAKLLHGAGVELHVADLDQELVDLAVKNYGAKAVSVNDIHKVDVDIFAPCALGAVINDDTINELKCSIVAGAANNQLDSTDLHGGKLNDMGILYAPDYVINSGGLINAANAFEGDHQRRAFQQAEGIYDTLMRIFTFADKEGVPTNRASDYIAEERLRQASKLKKIYKPGLWGREYYAKMRQTSRS
ncbi:MAG: leucine dehydrogenase [Chlamydiales bacterium]